MRLSAVSHARQDAPSPRVARTAHVHARDGSIHLQHPRKRGCALGSDVVPCGTYRSRTGRQQNVYARARTPHVNIRNRQVRRNHVGKRRRAVGTNQIAWYTRP